MGNRPFKAPQERQMLGEMAKTLQQWLLKKKGICA
jgi:hypothetical protein